MNKELEWSDPQPPTATVKYCHSVAGDFRIECHGDTWRLFFYDALISESESLEALQACASTIARNVPDVYEAYCEGYDDGDSSAQPGVNTGLCYSERQERDWLASDTYKKVHRDDA